MTSSHDTSTPRLVALQHRDFRLLWVGQMISVVGSQMQLAAVDWHVSGLLRGQSFTLILFNHPIHFGAEALGLGTLGLVRVVPVIIFSMLGGMVADAQDRRTVMLFTQTALAILAGILAAITLSGNEAVLAIYVLTAAMSAATAFDNPARQSLVPKLVPREHMTNAVSLNTLTRQVGTIAGPAVAGVLLARFNTGIVYAFNAVSFGAVVIALLLMQYRRSETVERERVSWEAMIEGVRYTFRSRIIWSTMLLDFTATFFASARTMLPIVARDILHVGAQGYGLLLTAQPLGSLIAGAIVSLRKDIQRQGVVLLVAVAIYGAATALFGLSTLYGLSYLLYAFTGAGDTISTVIRGTIRQLVTPDHLRGRMSSVNMVFFMGGPQLGEIEAGLVGSLFGVPVAIVTGGIATILFTALIAYKYPGLRNYTFDQLTRETQAA